MHLIKIDVSKSGTAYTNRGEISGAKKGKKEKEGERTICRECYQGYSYKSLSPDSSLNETKAEAKV